MVATPRTCSVKGLFSPYRSPRSVRPFLLLPQPIPIILLDRKSATKPLSAANLPLCLHIHSTSNSLQAATQSGCYSVMLSQRYNQTTCSRLSCRPKGLSVWLTKAKV